jgi:uncharacterized damage-inducible protein DinB
MAGNHFKGDGSLKRSILIAAIAGAGLLQAQNAGTYVTEAKQAYNQIKNNITRAADKMPDSDYSFKPTPDVRNFGQLISHIADAQNNFCSTLTGDARKPSAADKTSKADLVAALKESFDECDKAYDSVSDSNASEVVGQGFMKRSRLGILNFNVVHDNEMYGTMAVYLRLKGIVPPSSEPRGGKKGN